ncbi:MAG: beta-agarase [Roseibacillus sp.]
MKPLFFLACLLLTAALSSCQEDATAAPTTKASATVLLTINPEITRSIEGHSQLERQRYFALAESGKGFAKRVDEEHYHHLVNELDISFGREIGPIRSVVNYSRAVRQDLNRPGFIDLDYFKQQIAKKAQPDDPTLAQDFAPNLNVAAHGSPGAYPKFMGQWMTDTVKKEKSNKHPKVIPANHAASAELAAAVFQYNYTDLTRPRFFEPINEPHWSFLTQSNQTAQWHLAVRDAIKAATPEVLVGGPCNAVGYFYRNNYQSFNGLQSFMDATANQLDFYSFHTYDYYRWEDDQFKGNHLSGAPLDGVLDLVPNYAHLTQDQPCQIVISEQGGYANGGNGDSNHKLIMKAAQGRVLPRENESDFDYALRARSMHDFIHLNSIIGNIVTYMEHPHTVLKAVPFLLHNAAAWDPYYYAVLCAPQDFQKDGKLVPTELQNFYRLFAGVDGRRVLSHSDDPDIACRSFVKDDQLFIIAHNFSEKSETLSLELPQPEKLTLRRLGRNPDLTLNYSEQPSESTSTPLAPLETLIFIADYASPIQEKSHHNETVHYGDQVIVDSGTPIQIPTPNTDQILTATLRIGFTTPHEADKSLLVKINGKLLPDHLPDSITRNSNPKGGYATTRVFPLDPKYLKADNTIEVSLAEGTPGKIGTATIRAQRPFSQK